FAVLGGRAFDGLARDAHGLTVLARGGPITRLATAAPAAPPLAAVAVSFAFAGCRFGGIVGQSLGLLGFDLGFGFGVERLVVVIGFLDLRREGGSLRRQQRLGSFQRVHLFAAVYDERLLAGDGWIGADRKRHLEGVFEIAQMAALVVQHIERDIGAGAHHQIVGRALHQNLFD